MNDGLRIAITREGIALTDKLESLPTGNGVYQFRDGDGNVLYVGKAKNLRNRVRQYFQKSRTVDPRLETMLSKVSDVEIIVTDSEVEALILEANLIKKLKPRYNVNLKDDKSYPYIVITNEPFPRVFVTRQIRHDGSRYFGPYTDVKNVRAALKAVRDMFMIRSCNYAIDDEAIRKRKFKVCLDYHIKKCEGPCEGLVSQPRYNAMIAQVASVLEGKTETLIASLQSEMASLAENLKFEEAAQLRDRIEGLKAYSERQNAVSMELIDRDIIAVASEGDDACGVIFKVRDGKMIGRHHRYLTGVDGKSERDVISALVQLYYLDVEYIPKELLLSAPIVDERTMKEWLSLRRGDEVVLVGPDDEETSKLIKLSLTNARFLIDELKIQRIKRADYLPHSVKSLQKDLHLENPPRRIECFDISNIQGADAAASMVVFVDGKPRKNDYRKFRIRSVAGPDDFASLREVIQRRYSRLLQEGSELPDLVMVDGGKGQLSSAVEVLKSLNLRGQSVIGLAKRLEEVFTPGNPEPLMIPKSSSGLRLLQRIRDEAHRFAVAYHRTLRSKRTLQTELDLIEGIGKKRAKELIDSFGSVQGVKFASEEQLAEIVGEKVAARIKEYFDTAEAENADITG
jgi:excinuclease ABC subunit C